VLGLTTTVGLIERLTSTLTETDPFLLIRMDPASAQ
jgi:hypothetical protein